MKNIYKNLENQFNKVFRHLKVGSFKTRERYAKAFKRFMVYLAKEYRLQKLSNISKKHITAYLKHLRKKGLAPSTIKTELAAIRFFHDNMPYAKHKLPANGELELKRRTFGGVDRTWSNREYNLMVCKAMETNHNDYAAILTLARYGGLRLEECFHIDTNDAENAIETGNLFVKGKGGLTRYVLINKSIEIVLRNSLIISEVLVMPKYKINLKALMSFKNVFKLMKGGFFENKLKGEFQTVISREASTNKDLNI